VTVFFRHFEKQTPIIDAHSHMGSFRSFNIPMNGPDGMIQQMDSVGIDVACISHHSSISADVNFGNNEIARAIREYPARFIGFCVTNPNYPSETHEQIERCFSQPGFGGFKAHPELHGNYPLDGPGYAPMWEYANAHSLPILSHSYFGGDRLDVFKKLAEKYPNTTVLLGHAGLDLGLENAVALTQSVPNVVLDMTAMQRHCGAVEHLVSLADPSKLVWGSDMPFIDPGMIIGAVVLADISTEVRNAILYDNMSKILRITVSSTGIVRQDSKVAN